MSKILVLNVFVNRQDVIVFVKQSGIIADVWTHKNNRPSIHRPRRIIAVILNELFQNSQVNWQKFVVDLFGVGEIICAKRLSQFPCCFPVKNVEPFLHVNDGNSSSKSIFKNIGHCVSFCHQCTATNFF